MTKRNERQHRHGDVGLTPATTNVERPRNCKPRKEVVLALGEATGHAHRVKTTPKVKLYEWTTPGGQRWLQVDGDEPATLTHEEHGEQLVQPGTYLVIQQREFVPEEERARPVYD